MNDIQDRFTAVFQHFVKRSGAEDLLCWMTSANCDFFVAPASTKYHLAREGGLALHSLHVYERLQALVDQEAAKGCEEAKMYSTETIAIVGLLHDLCKANFYGVEMRNKKNDAGKWEQVPFYVVNDQFPYGHGEKSVYIISSFLQLTRPEALAIRWHMGFSDNDFRAGGQCVSNAFSECPLAVLAHIADLQATYLDEVKP